MQLSLQTLFTLLTTITVSGCAVTPALATLEASDIPDNQPCLFLSGNSECQSSVLLNSSSIKYGPGPSVPVKTYDGGFILQQGQFENILQFMRDQQDEIIKLKSNVSF